MDQRRAARRRVLKAGTIEFGGSTLTCSVRDRSDTGAMLDVPSPIGIPDQFVLATNGSRIPCRVVWRSEKRIGIAFK
jgi:PilZ domain